MNSTEIEESKKEVLFGVTNDYPLTFNDHINNLFGTINYKLHYEE